MNRTLESALRSKYNFRKQCSRRKRTSCLLRAIFVLFSKFVFSSFLFSLVLLRTKDIEKEKNSKKKKRVCFCLNKQSKDFFSFQFVLKISSRKKKLQAYRAKHYESGIKNCVKKKKQIATTNFAEFLQLLKGLFEISEDI